MSKLDEELSVAMTGAKGSVGYLMRNIFISFPVMKRHENRGVKTAARLYAFIVIFFSMTNHLGDIVSTSHRIHSGPSNKTVWIVLWSQATKNEESKICQKKNFKMAFIWRMNTQVGRTRQTHFPFKQRL